jgi:NAD(P)H-dependent FMN reductase
MSQKVLILVASTGKNVELADSLAAEITAQGGEPDIVNLVELGLPLYVSNAEKESVPPAALEMSERMGDSRALVFVAPEYNGALPPTLVNLIAWVSVSGDADWRAAFNGKMAAIATFSGGGGQSALAAMRSQLSFLGVNVLGRQILTNYKKPLNPESATAVIQQLLALTA